MKCTLLRPTVVHSHHSRVPRIPPDGGIPRIFPSGPFCSPPFQSFPPRRRTGMEDDADELVPQDERYSLSAHIAALSPRAAASLYASAPHVVRASLVALPPMARLYAMRLSLLNEPVSKRKVVDAWPTEAAIDNGTHERAMEGLRSLHLLAEREGEPEQGDRTVALADGVKRHIRDIMTRGWAAVTRLETTAQGGSRKRSRENNAPQPPPSAEALADTVRERWEGMLLCLASDDPEKKDADTVETRRLLMDAGLVEKRDGVCTPEGLRFLLCPPQKQLWRLLSRLLRDQPEQHVADALSLLARIAWLKPGTIYRIDALREGECVMLPRLALLGLLWASAGTYFCATPLAAKLVGEDHVSASAVLSSTPASSSSVIVPPSDGYILVESNFRVYSYFRSELEEKLVHLFCQPETKLPNLFVSIITRESVTRALDYGASADLILSFLMANAHPRTRLRHGASVPECVSDAIRLWESERQRVSSEPAVLYANFDPENVQEFDAIRAHAIALDGLIHCSTDASNRFVVVNPRIHDALREFVRNRRAQTSASALPK